MQSVLTLSAGTASSFKVASSSSICGFGPVSAGKTRPMTEGTTRWQRASSSIAAPPHGPRLTADWSQSAGEERPIAHPDDVRPRHVLIPIGTVQHPATLARRAVRDHCSERVPAAVVDDLSIIVSELVANVLEHGGGSEGMSLELTIRDTEVDVHVIGHGDRRAVPPLGEWHLPPAAQRTGRGLALVRRLSRWVTIDGDEPVRDHRGWISITASLRLPPS